MKFSKIPRNWIRIDRNTWYEPYCTFFKKLKKRYKCKRFVFRKICVMCKNYSFTYLRKRKYCSRKCANIANKTFGSDHPGWKGGRRMDVNGYVLIKPQGKNYVFEHRRKMERYLGRPLLDSEVVHHVNCIKSDNRIVNLRVMTYRDHSLLHRKMERETRHK